MCRKKEDILKSVSNRTVLNNHCRDQKK